LRKFFDELINAEGSDYAIHAEIIAQGLGLLDELGNPTKLLTGE
jgi:hypothetical protein